MTEKEPLSPKVLHKLALHPLPRVLSRPGPAPELKGEVRPSEPLKAAPGAVVQQLAAAASSGLSLVEIQERAAARKALPRPKRKASWRCSTPSLPPRAPCCSKSNSCCSWRKASRRKLRHAWLPRKTIW